MYHMAKASVRDLRFKFHEVEDLLRSGQEVEITKRKRVIARLVPIRGKKRRKLPDFYGRMRKIFGKKKMAVSNAELLAWDRGKE
jgi:antitoxin (DNA-binding transcriptional repressor) of toxin-antitoxin stability system